MHVQLATLAHLSARQLREAIRRATAVRPAHECLKAELDFLAGVEVQDSTWGEWEETVLEAQSVARN